MNKEKKFWIGFVVVVGFIAIEVLTILITMRIMNSMK